MAISSMARASLASLWSRDACSFWGCLSGSAESWAVWEKTGDFVLGPPPPTAPEFCFVLGEGSHFLILLGNRSSFYIG